MSVNALAAMEAKQALQPFSYDPDALGYMDAEVKISHCGVCHSDLHLIDNDWRNAVYPLVPGHEIIGEVVALGDGADLTLMGQRVGIGWQRGSCHVCDSCVRGEENLCPNLQNTTVDNYGGFAESIRVDSRFCFPIPDALSSENAAPLLCAGITVFEPLFRHNITARQHVGVIGIGGLGHLGVQFAKALGCEVTAFSSSESKKDEAMQLGATHFVNSRERGEVKKMRGELDFIISTVSVNLDWNEYLRCLKHNGTLCFVGALDEKFEIKPWILMDNQSRLTASNIGGRHSMREMLRFAAAKNIQAWTEKLPFDAANTAVERLRKNDVRYRFVLEH